MNHSKDGRRQFVKSSLAGLGSLSLSSLLNKVHSDTGNKQSRQLQILCVGAHPGDPEFGCGGTLAKLSNAEHVVDILYLTRGEAFTDRQSFEQSAAQRTKEAENSCRILKAMPFFAGQIDGNTELNKQQNEAITKLILSRKPDLVFTHWPVDSHPDHQVAGLLTLNAWIRSNKQFHLYFYEVNTGSETMGFTPTEYVDISDVRDKKKAAMFAHETQDPQQVYESFFRTMEEFRGLEVSTKAAEAFVYFKPNDKRSAIMQ